MKTQKAVSRVCVFFSLLLYLKEKDNRKIYILILMTTQYKSMRYYQMTGYIVMLKND